MTVISRRTSRQFGTHTEASSAPHIGFGKVLNPLPRPEFGRRRRKFHRALIGSWLAPKSQPIAR